MILKELISILESWAPPAYQESYDNSGLIFGDKQTEVTGVILSLDCIEATIQEAIDKNCNVVVAHHPIVFKGLKSLTGKNYIERTVIKAIQNNIAIYAIHTNLDSVSTGVNKKFADKIGIQNPKILRPKSNSLKQLTTYIPKSHLNEVRDALFAAGLGEIGNYKDCGFASTGEGSFTALDQAKPFVGSTNERHYEEEIKFELVFPSYLQHTAINTLKQAHPYEEVAFQVISLENSNQYVGSGMYGKLENEMETIEFLKHIKSTFNVGCIKHTALINKTIKTVAICGGSGSFLLGDAKAKQADIFITGDFKYHEFFDAEDQIIIADIGHYESEYLTIELIDEKLREKNCNFAVYRSELNTNPVNYF